MYHILYLSLVCHYTVVDDTSFVECWRERRLELDKRRSDDPRPKKRKYDEISDLPVRNRIRLKRQVAEVMFDLVGGISKMTKWQTGKVQNVITRQYCRQEMDPDWVKCYQANLQRRLRKARLKKSVSIEVELVIGKVIRRVDDIIFGVEYPGWKIRPLDSRIPSCV